MTMTHAQGQMPALVPPVACGTGDDTPPPAPPAPLAPLLTHSPRDEDRVVNVFLANTGEKAQTCTLTLTRVKPKTFTGEAGEECQFTPRRLLRVVLDPDECCYVTGLTIPTGNELCGCCSDACCVDFTITSGSGSFGVVVLDATGNVRTTTPTAPAEAKPTPPPKAEPATPEPTPIPSPAAGWESPSAPTTSRRTRSRSEE